MLFQNLLCRLGGLLIGLIMLAGPNVPRAQGAEAPVRVAVLKFGTVNWELASMKHHGIDHRHGVDVQVTPYASSDATMVALLAGSADVVVDDWLLVSRQRQAGRKLSFVPYSTAVGSLMVAAQSPVTSLADLADLKIGVAGGPLDKNWLLIQGLARDQHGLDLARRNDVVYGAPPLLAQKAKTGELDAVLNYWHYSARLEALGFRRISSARAAADALGAGGPVSAIGYVFHESWAKADHKRIAGFIAASRATKQLLRDSDEEWSRLASTGAIRDKGVALGLLRDRFREGIPARSTEQEMTDAARVYQRLSKLGGRRLVGNSPQMSQGTYWRPDK